MSWEPTARFAPARARSWAPLALLLGAVLYALPLLVDVPLLDPDEGLHAAIAREMVETGEYVTPRLLGAPFLDKPVLFFWAQALSLRIFGFSEGAVRLPGLLFSLLGTLTTAWLAWRMLGGTAGVLAGFFYATLLLPMALAQAAVHDVALVPWTNLALLFFWRAQQRAAGAKADDPTGSSSVGAVAALCATAGLWLGLAVLTKGLSGVALVGLPFTLYLLVAGRLRMSLVIGGVLALLVMTVVALPWYLAMERGHPGYLHYFFVERHLLGFATATQLHGWRPWWYYLPVLVAGALPWFGAIFLARPSRTRGAEPGASRALAFLWIWLVADVLFLSAAGSKLLTYLLPVFPAVAILAAAAWAPRLHGERVGRWFELAARSHPVAMAIVLPAVVVALRLRNFPVALPLVLMAGAFSVLWLIAAWWWGRVRPDAWLTGCVALMAATALAGMVLLASVAPFFSARELAAHFNREGAVPGRLWILDERVGSFLFYLDPSLRQGLAPAQVQRVTPDVVYSMRHPPADTLIAIPIEAFPDVSRRVDLTGAPYEPAGGYRLYHAETVHAAIAAAVGRDPATAR
jgi:4-amino-4-deoxy-L-arabinose transferase-like glycosyltransferase